MQQLNPSEISEIIKQRIDTLDVSSEAQNEGTIVSVSDGVIRIHGLADVMYGEMIEFEGGVYGMALNLERDSVGAVVLGDYHSLAEGQKADAGLRHGQHKRMAASDFHENGHDRVRDYARAHVRVREHDCDHDPSNSHHRLCRPPWSTV